MGGPVLGEDGLPVPKPKKARYSLYAETGEGGELIPKKPILIKKPKPRKKEPEYRVAPPPPGRILPMLGGYYVTSTGKKSHKKLSYSVWNSAVAANGGKLGDGTPWPPPKDGSKGGSTTGSSSSGTGAGAGEGEGANA